MKNSRLMKAVAAITLSAVSAAAGLGTAGCAHKHSWGNYVADGENGHYKICSACNEKENVAEHDYNADYKCGVCDYQHTHTYAESWTTTDGSATHWHESTCGHDVISGETAHNYQNFECTDCGAEQESVVETYEFNASNHDTGTATAPLTAGIFTVGAGTPIRGRARNVIYENDSDKVVVESASGDTESLFKNSVQLKDDNGSISFKTTTAGVLTIYLENGSSGASAAAIKINDKSVSYNKSGARALNYEITAAGTYTIKRNGSVNGTTDIYYMAFKTRVPVTPVESISVVNKGVADYYVGQKFDYSKIAVNAVYQSTGRTAPVDIKNLVIDDSKFNSAEAGTYEIGVSYTCEDGTFNTKYNVNVYSFESITVDNRYTVKESQNSAAGNGVYVTHWLREFYFKGESLDADGLVVILNGKNGSATKSFTLAEGQYTLSGYDMNSVGKQKVTVTVEANGVERKGEFDIIVADRVDVVGETEIKLNIDASCADEQTCVKNGDAYSFKTIRQSLEFLDALNVADEVKKTISLAAGTYNEKLEIIEPNVTIIGAGKDATKIEFNELWGVKDATGFEQTTDSTATLNVRDTAVGFKMSGVTVSNYYNTLDKYNGAPSTDKRALAMLVQADKVVVEDCVLLGYQDTLELFTGRQMFKNCLIKGAVDFIFGTNNTTYFYQCEINSIKAASGGGYITAMKGQNKGSTDSIKYGLIFDDCDFTAEVGVSGTSVGRTWGADAAVMIMNSRLGGHISKTNKTSGGGRFTVMNNNKIENAQFKESNNTGDGALTANLVNGSAIYCEVLSVEAAANYNKLEVIFGKVNGKVTYADVWDITV